MEVPNDKIVWIDYSGLVLTPKQKKLIKENKRHLVQLTIKQRISIKMECICGTYVSAHCYQFHIVRESHKRYVSQLKNSYLMDNL
jgi:hypothetical protein